jgi:hypothetical protein
MRTKKLFLAGGRQTDIYVDTLNLDTVDRTGTVRQYLIPVPNTDLHFLITID